MTRPDDRLLVPVGCLPFVPRGALLWLDANSPCVASSTQRWSSGALLDLSAPTLRDGVPERMDALPWALAVLGWFNAPAPSLTFGWVGGGCPVWPSRDDAASLPDVDRLDLSGLTDNEASRAVVAAALRQRGAA